jgi:predicted lipid carrier protein YhbT
MPAFLSQGWVDLQAALGAELPERPGATARIAVVVTGGPDGEVGYVQNVRDGRVAAVTLGRADDVDVTLTQTHADAVAIARGELDANAAFMQGRVKVVGDMGALMAVLPLTQSAEYRSLVSDLAAQTDF